MPATFFFPRPFDLQYLENIWDVHSVVYMLPFNSQQTPTANKGSLTSPLDVFNQRLQISESPVTHLTYLTSLFMKLIQMADLIGAYFVLVSPKQLEWHGDSRKASLPLKAKWQFDWIPPSGVSIMFGKASAGKALCGKWSQPQGHDVKLAVINTKDMTGSSSCLRMHTVAGSIFVSTWSPVWNHTSCIAWKFVFLDMVIYGHVQVGAANWLLQWSPWRVVIFESEKNK